MLHLKNIGKAYRQISALAKRNTTQSLRSLCLLQNRKADQKCSEPKETPLMDVKCKAVVFSSGCTGIGFEAANQLLCEGARHIFISGMNLEAGESAEETLQKKHGEDKITYLPGDVRDDRHLKGLFQMCKEKYEQVDIFINDAAILEDRYWKHTVDINMAGVMRTCLLGMHYMGKNEAGKGGVIVNLSSIYGLQPLPGAPVYCATKYAVIGITMNLGDQFYYKSSCVRVVAVCPGLTNTAHIEDVADKQYNEEWGEELEEEFEQGNKQPPEAVAKAIAYVVKMAPSGTVWVAEDCKLFKAEIPDRSTYSKLIGELK